MKFLHPKYYIFLSIVLILSSCGVHKHAQKPLLSKNKIIVHGEKHELEKDEIKSLITQSPNKIFLGIWRFKLYSYQLPERKKANGFNLWMRKTFGEPPVFYEPQTIESTKRQIQIYLNNSGYFNSRVWVQHDFKKRSFSQFYNIQLTTPYRIRNFEYHISDTVISQKVEEIKDEKLIHSGDIYNAYTLDDERDRITEHLRNNGYFNFSKEYIYYEVDSALNSKQLDIKLLIKRVEKPNLSNPTETISEDHKQYKINRVIVNPNYDLLNPNPAGMDTLLVNINRDTSKLESETYYFLHEGNPKIKPKAIIRAVLIKPNEFFSLDNVRTTYRWLADLKNFKYTNIHFKEVDKPSSGKETAFLDCYIDLSRAKKRSISVELEGTNSGGNFGLGVNFIHSNKNIFRGAETLDFRIHFSGEDQHLSSSIETAGKKILFFDAYEFGFEARLTFPRFLIPINPDIFPQNFKPHTSINLGLNLQQRPNYKRYITNISFGYEWIQNERSRHLFNPFELSTVKVFPTSSFEQALQDEPNERIRNQYIDHLVPALKYSYIYNSQDINKLKDFIYFRANFESSGFLLKGIQTLLKVPETEDGYNTMFKIRYAQFIRADLDFRYYKILTKDSRMVFRCMFGIGFPYGNSEDLPFEKGFFAGGANGMRGWGVRSLGPGSSVPEDNLADRLGDLRMEFNIEYRFPIHRFLGGALFADAGNVWRYNNEVIPGAAFELKNFHKELGVDAGLGFRFDFRFFIFRIDGAIRIRDPEQPEDNRWVIKHTKFNKIVWNFGIGYPF